VLTLAILIEWFRQRQKLSRKATAAAITAALMPVIALAGFEIWRINQGLPGTLEVQLQFWHRVPAFPWEGVFQTVTRIADHAALPIEILDLVVVLGMLLAGIRMLRRLPASFSIYHWGLLLLNLSQLRLGQPLSGQARYSVALFPAFILLAGDASGRISSRVVAYSFLSLNVFLAGQFILWGWVG
jgi:hypothetical protein